MAQSKRFYFWHEYYDAMLTLPSDELRWKLIDGICQFAFYDVEPDFSNEPILGFAWAMIRGQVRRSVEIGVERSKAGLKSATARRKKSVPNSVQTNDEHSSQQNANTVGNSVQTNDEHSSQQNANTVGNSVPNEMNCNESSDCAPSLDAQALVAETDPDELRARRELAMAEIERAEAEELGGDD